MRFVGIRTETARTSLPDAVGVSGAQVTVRCVESKHMENQGVRIRFRGNDHSVAETDSRENDSRPLNVNGYRARSGTVLICTLACLIIVSALVASTLQVAMRDRRAAQLERRVRQTELLCEAGVLRASQQLKDSSAYAGEQWRPKLALKGYEEADAMVDIRVTPLTTTGSRQVEVVATIGTVADNQGRTQRTHLFTFERSPN